MKYSEILLRNRELAESLEGEPYPVLVLSNVIVHQLKEILEYELRSHGINADVRFGDYDNIVQESFQTTDAAAVIVFYEVANLVEGLHVRASMLSDSELDELQQRVKQEIGMICNNLVDVPLLMFNAFTASLFNHDQLLSGNLERVAEALNERLRAVTQKNLVVTNPEQPIRQVSVSKAFNARDFSSSKSLYTVDFHQAYAGMVSPYIRSATGRSKKALIFDCDNTLWKGILGEDGFTGIRMDAGSRDGGVFHEIQLMALALNRQGVILGICSKNNKEETDAVFRDHPDMLLREEHIAVNMSSWDDKVTGLRNIAEQLNIGLDSMVFVDDSSFEVEFVRENLPEVTVLQVPQRLYEYPSVLASAVPLFYQLSSTDEDKDKARMIRENIRRKEAEEGHTDLDAYLASLNLKVRVNVDDCSSIERLAQLTQKTNQFNLTTIRYTSTEIDAFCRDGNARLISISVSDRFGESGITGLAILDLEPQNREATIDTFLMSCRVIGRKIEFALMDFIAGLLHEEGYRTLHASYAETPKNHQVSDFYLRCGMQEISANESDKVYRADVENYPYQKIEFIEVINESDNE